MPDRKKPGVAFWAALAMVLFCHADSPGRVEFALAAAEGWPLVPNMPATPIARKAATSRRTPNLESCGSSQLLD